MTSAALDLFAYAARHGPRPWAPAEGVPEDVCRLFEEISLDVHAKGWKRFSADMVLHRIRWEMHVERGNRSFRCNDHWTSVLARWFLARHPDMPKFFELRELRSGQAD